MNALTTNQSNAFRLREPDLSPRLRGMLDEFIPSQGYVVSRDADRDEARAALRLYGSLTRPSNRDMILHWLEGLAASVRNPPSPDEIEMRHVAVCTMLADLPLGVWTHETLTRAGQTFKFWPSVADLNDLLRPIGDGLHRRYRNAQRIANADVATVRGVSPEQERAYIDSVAQSKADARAANSSAQAADQGAPGAGDAMPTREALVATYSGYLEDPDPANVEMARAMLRRLEAPEAASDGEATPRHEAPRHSSGLRSVSAVAGLPAA